jgi:transaldolase
MLFFLDTANLDAIKTFSQQGVISGVTTNPSLMAKEGVKKADTREHAISISQIIDGPISVEVNSTTFSEMILEAREIASWHTNIVVKLPCTQEGILVCKTLASEGIKTNITLIFTPLQALIAAKAGATYVSPFIGRLEDAGQDGVGLVNDIRTIFDNYDISTLILSASFRSIKQITEVALIGSDAATVSPEIMNSALKNIFTQKGLEDFQRASK